MKYLNKGLSAFQIKVIALIFMTIDHIGIFASNLAFVNRYYNLFRIIGRISAPLFLFILIQSLQHTKSKPKFLLRLWIASISVSLFNYLFNYYFNSITLNHIPSNIMYTFFYITLFILLIEKFITYFKQKNYRKCILYILLFSLSLLPTIFLRKINLFLYSFNDNYFYIMLKNTFFPSLYDVDYKFSFIILGVILYFLKNKNKQIIAYTIFCLLIIIGYYTNYNFFIFQIFLNLSSNRIQHFMILAIPFMLLYNGQRGKNIKNFFYIYYLLHRQIIMLIVFLNTSAWYYFCANF